MNKLKTSIAEMYIDEDGILRVKLLDGVTVDLAKSKEYIADTIKLLDGKKALILFDASSNYKITEEAKAYGASKEYSSHRIAVAYLTKSITNKLIFNLYLKVNAPIVPTKMFSSEERALKWLKSFFVLPGDKFEKPKRK